MWIYYIFGCTLWIILIPSLETHHSKAHCDLAQYPKFLYIKRASEAKFKTQFAVYKKIVSGSYNSLESKLLVMTECEEEAIPVVYISSQYSVYDKCKQYYDWASNYYGGSFDTSIQCSFCQSDFMKIENCRPFDSLFKIQFTIENNVFTYGLTKPLSEYFTEARVVEQNQCNSKNVIFKNVISLQNTNWDHEDKYPIYIRVIPGTYELIYISLLVIYDDGSYENIKEIYQLSLQQDIDSCIQPFQWDTQDSIRSLDNGIKCYINADGHLVCKTFDNIFLKFECTEQLHGHTCVKKDITANLLNHNQLNFPGFKQYIRVLFIIDLWNSDLLDQEYSDFVYRCHKKNYFDDSDGSFNLNFYHENKFFFKNANMAPFTVSSFVPYSCCKELNLSHMDNSQIFQYADFYINMISFRIYDSNVDTIFDTVPNQDLNVRVLASNKKEFIPKQSDLLDYENEYPPLDVIDGVLKFKNRLGQWIDLSLFLCLHRIIAGAGNENQNFLRKIIYDDILQFPEVTCNRMDDVISKVIRSYVKRPTEAIHQLPELVRYFGRMSYSFIYRSNEDKVTNCIDNQGFIDFYTSKQTEIHEDGQLEITMAMEMTNPKGAFSLPLAVCSYQETFKKLYVPQISVNVADDDDDDDDELEEVVYKLLIYYEDSFEQLSHSQC